MHNTRDLADSALTVNASAGAGVLLFGWTLNDVYSALGIAVLLIQFGYWLYKRFSRKD